MSTFVAKLTVEEVVEPNMGANRSRGITAGRHKVLEIELANPTYVDLLKAVAGYVSLAVANPPTVVPKNPVKRGS